MTDKFLTSVTLSKITVYTCTNFSNLNFSFYLFEMKENKRNTWSTKFHNDSVCRSTYTDVDNY